MRHRVVFDVNVLFSAAISEGGSPAASVRLLIESPIRSITSGHITDKLAAKLRTKTKLSQPSIAKAVAAIKLVSEITDPPPLPEAVTQDPEDDLVLACAVAGRATHTVTGDKRHLLPLREYRGIRILSPAEFLQLMQS